MTDHHDRDDLASAHLDGLTSPRDAARVAADGELLAQVERLAAVRAALRAGVQPDPTRRAEAIAAALAAFDAEGSPASVGSPSESVGPLATAPFARRRPARRTLQLVGIAAAAALAALTVPLLSRLGSEPDRDLASEPKATTDALAGGQAESAGDAAPSTTLAPVKAGAGLGAFPDLPSLTASVRARLDDDGRAATAGPSQAPGLSDQATSSCAAREVSATGVVLVADAVLGDQPVVVVVRTNASGDRALTVLDAASCAVLTVEPL